ncbi:hypothetical protein [Glutamicibacter soli]|uniref:hypothetical protein n=1 Tax=Glutamicibacter soli TaxID=453836 RepID=UPI003FD648B1
MNLEEFGNKPTRSVKDLSGLLGTGINQTYAAVNAGIYPAIRQGKRILIPTAPIVAMLEGRADGRGAK